MRSFHRPQRAHALFFACLLATVCALALSPAYAAVIGCRADPVVKLSDGTVLDVSVDIDANVSDVSAIHYTIHAPKGVYVVAVIHTPTIGFTGHETFSYADDTAPGSYVTETLVHTTQGQVAVSAHTAFATTAIRAVDSPLALKYRTAQGYSGEVLRVSLHR